MAKPFDIYVNEVRFTPEDNSIITEAKGINPVKANLYSLDTYNRDGSYYQGATIGTRNIVLTVNIPNDVLTVRETVLAVLRTGEDVQLKFVNDKTYYIDGVIESVEYDRFVKPTGVKQVIQASIICFEPFFYSDEISARSGSIQYDGDVEAGFKVVITKEGGGAFGLENLFISKGSESLDFGSNDEVMDVQSATQLIVDTEQKKAYYINTDDEEISILKYWHHENTWLKLSPGANTITVFYEPATVEATIKYTSKFNRL